MRRTSVGLNGCAGRMGRMLADFMRSREDVVLAGGAEALGHPSVGSDLGALLGGKTLGVPIHGAPADLLKAVDVVVDFSTSAASLALAKAASRAGRSLIIGTDGFSRKQLGELRRYARRIPIVFVPNSSAVFALMVHLVSEAARILDGYDIEIAEFLHNRNVRAPTITSLELFDAIARSRKRKARIAPRTPDGGKIPLRDKRDVGIAYLRGGGAVGEHSVWFAGPGEILEIQHRVASRDVHLAGVLDAAVWSVGRKPGFYSMKDVIGLGEKRRG